MSESKNLTLADLTSAYEPAVTPVEIPELGGRVHVRELTGLDQLLIDQAKRDAEEGDGQVAWTAKLLELCVCHPDKRPLFESDAQARKFLAKGTKVCSPFINKVLRATGLVNDEEDAAKNSPEAQP